VGDQPVSYVDYRAVEQARPGAAQPTSFAALDALRAANDPSARLWLAAYQGIASGSGDLLMNLFAGAPDWPSLLGFDFFDIDREVAFGEPPSNGEVLLGRFDPTSIEAAYAARGFTQMDQDGRTLLCGPDGCDAGLTVHADQRNPANPFGGNLGRSQPLAISATELDNSAAIDTVQGILDTASGTTPSLAADPDYRAAAEAASAAGTVIQATLVPAALLSADPGEGGASAAPIPAYDLLFFADGASDTEQVVQVGLVYENPADAQMAVDALPGRIDALNSVVTGQPVRQLLDERGVTSIQGQVIPSSDGTRSVALFELRAPLASSDPDPGTGLMTASSIIYKTLVDMLYRRDLQWLAPTAVPAPS
jgi:hypothetical protein